MIGIALLILGSKFLIGDDETKARGRKQVPYIILGAGCSMAGVFIAVSGGVAVTFYVQRREKVKV